MPMKDPAHPGDLVLHDCLEPLGLSITEGAKVLGVSRQALSSLVNRRAGISIDMAIRLEKAFDSTADCWLRMQSAWDIARARERADEIKVERYLRESVRVD